ncbi:MAG: phage tail protein [Desulfobulbaceae bacterium]|nr:phage tail protein [Pseudomonadota bacterium]MCG2747000.1 phage tail protein [Desulfobulbaceae bacterium]
MDANRQKFWMLASENQWHRLGDPPDLEYDGDRRSLRLAHQRRFTAFADSQTIARDRLELIPQTLDQYGNRAYWDSDDNSLIATGAMKGKMVILTPGAETGPPTDMAMGHDGVLYMAINGQVLLHDRRDRWDDTTVSAPEFNPWRLAAIPDGGMWVLDRVHGKLGRIQGLPYPRRPFTPYDSGVFRPCQENPNPPRLEVLENIGWPQDETPVALACSLEGKLAVLSWGPENSALIRCLDNSGQLTAPIRLNGVNNPYSISWVSSQRLAVLLAMVGGEAPVYALGDTSTSLWPVGDLYPLKQNFTGGPFLHGIHYPPYYPTVDGCRALRQLSFPFFTKHGFAVNDQSHAPLDSGNPQMVWHRLYLEAVIPQNCGIKIWLAATASPANIIAPEEWYEHRFGTLFANQVRSDVPLGVWERISSEVPHHPGLVPCDREPDRAGLFSVLIQRPGRRVRSLPGRFLHVRIEMIGNGHNTPEIFALRAYGSRFNYVQEYLPRLYWETTYAPEANEAGDATRADFFERFVHNMEGVLTNLEDRVAHSYLLTHPQTVPEESLDWLGSWIGYEFDQTLPQSTRRQYLQYAADLYRWHGTLRGLKLALEIGTNGAVSSGEIVILEDFRLRRTFATILGADLADENDPLTAGAAISGNSFVGDTLFLGDERKKEFLALFGADLPTDALEQAVLDAFFDRLAYRVTILVHEEVEPQDLGLIERIAAKEMPAHVEFRVLTTTHPFLVGVAALVGVDSYLAEKVSPRAVRIGQSHVGRRDLIQGPSALDPRLEGIGTGLPHEGTPRPVAFARDVVVVRGQDATLDASDSRASAGRRIIEYEWKYQQRSGD